MCVGELLVLLPRGVICVQCSWSYITERSSQWPRNRCFLHGKKKKAESGKVAGHIALEKKHLSVISAKGWFLGSLPSIHGFNHTVLWVKRLRCNLSLGRSHMALASVCRCGQIEINMRNYKSEGRDAALHSSWASITVVWEVSRPWLSQARPAEVVGAPRDLSNQLLTVMIGCCLPRYIFSLAGYRVIRLWQKSHPQINKIEVINNPEKLLLFRNVFISEHF